MTEYGYFIRIVLIIALLIIHSTNTTEADDLIWPQFRGPNSSGLAKRLGGFAPHRNTTDNLKVSGYRDPVIVRKPLYINKYGIFRRDNRLLTPILPRYEFLYPTG